MGGPLNFPVPFSLTLMDAFFSGEGLYPCVVEFGDYASPVIQLTLVSTDVTGNLEELPDKVICRHTHGISRPLLQLVVLCVLQ